MCVCVYERGREREGGVGEENHTDFSVINFAKSQWNAGGICEQRTLHGFKVFFFCFF